MNAKERLPSDLPSPPVDALDMVIDGLDSERRDRADLNGADLRRSRPRTHADNQRARQDTRRHAEPSYMKHRTEGHTETTIRGDTRADWSDAFALRARSRLASMWFVRKKNAPWYGKAGENSTIWASPSPKFIMRGSDEEK